MAWNPKLRVDLTEVFNRAYGSKPLEVRRTLRAIVNRADFKDDYGLAIIDTIIDRTLKGKDRYGDKFKGYSESYKDSLVYELYGKGSRVDLKLTGEMLASMQTKSSGSIITINFVDDLNAAKAHGHITGMSGRKGGVVRDFFGVSAEEEEKVLKTVIGQYTSGNELQARANDLLREIG